MPESKYSICGADRQNACLLFYSAKCGETCHWYVSPYFNLAIYPLI